MDLGYMGIHKKVSSEVFPLYADHNNDIGEIKYEIFPDLEEREQVKK